MQNRHSMSLGIHFHILRCSLLFSQPQPEWQWQPEKAPGWQKKPVPKPAPAPASGDIPALRLRGGCKFPRKRHRAAGASQTHHSQAQGRLRGEAVLVGRGRQCPVPALAPCLSWHLLPPGPTGTSAHSVLPGRAAPRVPARVSEGFRGSSRTPPVSSGDGL